MTPKHVRPVGALVLLLGVAMIYLFAYLPLEAAKHHTGTVHLPLKLACLGPAGIFLGAFLLVFGPEGRDKLRTQHAGRPATLKPLGWALALSTAGISVGFGMWLESAISACGYYFH
jgi:hypothetical protein